MRRTIMRRSPPPFATRVRIVTAVLLVASAHVPAAAADGHDAVRQTLERGAYADAETQALQLCSEVQATFGPESIELARASDLLLEALLKNGKARPATTLTLAERIVRIKTHHLGPDHVELAPSLHNLGMLHEYRGELRAALQLHQRALSARLRVLDSGSSDVADSLEAVARTLISLERHHEARTSIDRALLIREHLSAESPVALARTLELLGRLHRDAGRYADAALPLNRALDVWNRFAADHPDKTRTLSVRGDVHFLMGEVREARARWAEGLALAERTLGAAHGGTAQLVRSLAIAEFALGDLRAARRLRERALQIGERILPPCDPEVAYQLNDLAISLRSDADYIGARRLYRREIATLEHCVGPTHVNAATAIYNQFNLARDMGAFAEAEALAIRAVRIWETRLGPNHPFVAFGVSELADFLASRGQYVRARPLFERALRIRRQSLGPTHPDVAWTMTDLARTIGEAGDPTQALVLLRDAIAIFERAPARDPDYLARAVALRGSLEGREGNYGAARDSLAQALAVREKTYGDRHPLAAQTRAQMAVADFALASYDSALASALSAEEYGRQLLRFTVRYLPERQAMAYAATRPGGMDVLLSVVAAGKVADPSKILDAVILSRGVVLDELAARARARARVDPNDDPLSSSLTTAQQRLASLMLRSIEGRQIPAQMLDAAQREKESVEEALAEQRDAFRIDANAVSAGLDDVRRALPPDSALVSFVRYERTMFTTTGARRVRQTVPSYLAFVSRSGSATIEAVPLGPAASLDALVTAWHDEAGAPRFAADHLSGASAERAYRGAALRLRQRVWDRVADHVRNVSRIFIVPDGALNLVSFAALPTPAGRYLGEDAPPIHYVSTERDLVAAESASSGRGLLALGGPAYDVRVPRAASPGDRRSACRAAGPLRFDDLPGARAEVREVAAVWSSASGRADVADDDTKALMVLTGRAASKRAFTGASSGRRIIHLATHGFFLGSNCETEAGTTRAVGGLVQPIASSDIAVDNPLLLSGLSFAGANGSATRPSNREGILTAEEVTGLDLQGTEWAVLSACDTGLGEIKAGEGVVGLRRAFQIAGVHTIIMSLWPVDDQSTRRWMRALYEGRFQEHLTTADAVRAASVRMLRERRTRGQSTHPFYWAAFVAAGDWK